MSEPHTRPETTDPAADPAVERELRAVSALLRSLPQPTPPARLFERVMAEVARRESRPRLIRLFEQLPEPVAGLALAAGIGCLVLFGALESGLLVPGAAPETTHLARASARLEPSPARPIAVANIGALRARRPSVPPFANAAVIDPQLAAYVVEPGPESLPSLAPSARPRTNSFDGGLDRQLNHLLLDPISFYRRIEEVRDPESFVDRLAERAARRGDAAEVALRLRQRAANHPDTERLVERFLRAALDLHLSTR